MLRFARRLGWWAMALLFQRDMSGVGPSALPRLGPEYRYRLVGVGVIAISQDEHTKATVLDLLYAGSETVVVDGASDTRHIVRRGGPGVWNMQVPCLLPVRVIAAAAGDATDGEFRHHILPDGTHARELVVRDLYVRSVS
jgi:hypothetical protein